MPYYDSGQSIKDTLPRENKTQQFKWGLPCLHSKNARIAVPFYCVVNLISLIIITFLKIAPFSLPCGWESENEAEGSSRYAKESSTLA